MTTIDFNKLMQDAGEGFQPIPDGPYHVEVAKAVSEPTKTGKPMIRVQLRIIGGPHAGRLVFDQFVITADNPNALSFFFEHMAAFGLDRAFFAANPPMDQVAATLLNRQALIAVGTRTDGAFAGRNEVKKYSPPPMGQIGGMTVATAAPQVPATPPPAPAPVAQPPAPAPVPPAAAPAQVAPPPVPQPAPVPEVPQPVAAPIPPVPVQVPPQPVAPPVVDVPAAPSAVPPLPAGVVPPPQPVAPVAPVPEQPVAAPPPVAAAPPPAPVYRVTDEEPY